MTGNSRRITQNLSQVIIQSGVNCILLAAYNLAREICREEALCRLFAAVVTSSSTLSTSQSRRLDGEYTGKLTFLWLV